MFTQRISMDCTQEQYENFLENELIKMGYDISGVWGWHLGTDIITNIYSNILGKIGNTHKSDQKICKYKFTYLGKFNAPLFLALAAMTDSPTLCGYGEIATNGVIYEAWIYSGYLDEPYWRKASVKEIMKEYGKVKSEQPQSTPINPTYKELFEALKETQELLILTTIDPTIDRILKNEKLLRNT